MAKEPLFTLTPPQIAITALVLIASIFASLLIFRFRRESTSLTLPSVPKNTKPISTSPIIDLRIYPVKSCRGFSVPTTRLLRTGLSLDRQWMFVTPSTNKEDSDSEKEKWVFVTIRNLPKMTLINTSLSPQRETLHLSVDDPAIQISVPAFPTRQYLAKETTLVDVEIWGKETPAWMYPAELTSSLSNFLQTPVRLVYKGPRNLTEPRILRGNGAPQHLGREESLGFADMLPVLIASQASMDELNARLTDKANSTKHGPIDDAFDIERFRPNIVIQGGKAWEEDTWKTLKIRPSPSLPPLSSGPPTTITLDVPSRCLRCQVPNVEPSTAEPHPGNQPWDTLMQYRRIDPGLRFKPSFGMLCAPRGEGTVRVGDVLEVLEETGEHFFRSPMAA